MLTDRVIRTFDSAGTGEWWSSSLATMAIDLAKAGPLATALAGIAEILQEGEDPMWVVGGVTASEACAVAQEWLDSGVDAMEVADWLRAGCWDPAAARQMLDLGLRPARLLDEDGSPLHWVEASSGEEVSVAAAVADRFLSPEQALQTVNQP